MQLAPVTVFTFTLALAAAAQAQQAQPCQSVDPPVVVPRTMGSGTETKPGVRYRYRYDRGGRIVERRSHVLAAAPGAPVEGRDRFRYDGAGHLVETTNWSGIRILIERNASGHIERLRAAREDRFSREWIETRVVWSESSEERLAAPNYADLVVFAWHGRLLSDFLPVLDGGRSGTATTTEWQCTSRNRDPGDARASDAECQQAEWGAGELTYDGEGRLVQRDRHGRFERVVATVEHDHGLPVRVHEARPGTTQEEVTTLTFEGDRLASVTFDHHGQTYGHTRHFEFARGRLVRLVNRWRPATPYAPDRITTYRYRCR